MPEAPTKQGAPENGAPTGEALPPPAPGTAEKPTDALPPPAAGTAAKPAAATPRPDDTRVSPTADTATHETVPPAAADAPLPPPSPGTAAKRSEPLPPPTPGTGQRSACPTCSAPLARDQMVCTNCGTRNSLTWGRPTRGRAPLALAAVTLLVLGATAGLIAWAVSDDEETTKAEAEQAEPAPQAQAPAPVTPAPTPTPPTTPPPETTPPEGQTPPPEAAPSPTTPPEDTAPDSGGGDGIGKWPAGESAHTVILLSTDQRVGAERKAREVADAGFPAGLLRSNRYPSLNPGYWVVFVGQYDSASEASEKAEDLADQGYPGGYPRFVKSR